MTSLNIVIYLISIHSSGDAFSFKQGKEKPAVTLNSLKVNDDLFRP